MRKRQHQYLLECITILKEAHKEILNYILLDQLDNVLILLEQCQQYAIKIGESIEYSEGADHPAVILLEQYCDWLYEQYEYFRLQEKWSYKVFEKDVNMFYTKLMEQVKNNIQVQLEVVFLPYKASMWDSFESIWKSAQEDPCCNVYVIPIPYFDRNPDHTFGQLHDESNLYPSSVPIMNYHNYDFEKNQPDMIFIHNPYDDCNYVTSVHPFFYSKNLKRYTQNLVYVPYFVLEDISPQDESAIKSIEHFFLVPAVQYADHVVVQSKNMREIYIKVLTKRYGSQTKAIWEKKILGIGSPKMDKVWLSQQEFEIPKCWNDMIFLPDGTRKKVVLYNTGIVALLQYEEKLFEKIKDVFTIFQECQDEIILWWRPHPLILSTIESMRPQLKEIYMELTAQYKQEAWGIYDDTPNLDRAITWCDAYLGDPSSLVQICQDLGKPVLIQAIEKRGMV